jgi:hypothetical protein
MGVPDAPGMVSETAQSPVLPDSEGSETKSNHHCFTVRSTEMVPYLGLVAMGASPPKTVDIPASDGTVGWAACG